MAGVRRLDWRFLLPAAPGGYDHLILLGGDPALCALAAELGIARRVSASLSSGDAPDLVAVLSGASADPQSVVRALRPGGAWYWEFDRRFMFRRPVATAARLVRAGLGPSTAYWVRGGFTVPRLFVPLDRDAALAWYFATIFRHHSFGRRALRTGARLVTGWRGSRFARFVRHYALVGAGGSPGVLSAVASDHVGHDPRPLVLLGGEGDWSRVTFIPFATHRSSPTVVVKVARRAFFTRRTAQEQRVLRELCSRSPPSLSHSVPRALGFFDWHGLGVGVESCAAGAPLFGERRGTASRAAEQLAEAGAWLATLHAATERGHLHGAALRERIVAAPLADYQRVFGTEGGEAPLFEHARRHAERCDGVELPIVLQHGDFGPWNVFRDGREISVVDWEAARDGPPLCDLLYFVTHWLSRSGNSALPETALRLTFPLSMPRRDRFDEITRREIARYVGRLGVSEGLYPLLLLYTFVEQALDRAARLREQGAAAAGDRAANPYVACVSAIAGSADRLFQVGA